MVSFKNFIQESDDSKQSNLTEEDRYNFRTVGRRLSDIDFDFITTAYKVVKKIYSTYDKEDGEQPLRWIGDASNKEAISVLIETKVPFDKEEFERTGDGKVPYIWIKDSEQMELTIEKITKKINSMDNDIKVDYIKYDNSNDQGFNLDKGYIKCVFFVAIVSK